MLFFVADQRESAFWEDKICFIYTFLSLLILHQRLLKYSSLYFTAEAKGGIPLPVRRDVGQCVKGNFTVGKGEGLHMNLVL